MEVVTAWATRLSEQKELIETFVEFTLAGKEAKSDQKCRGCDLPHCESKDLEKVGSEKVD